MTIDENMFWISKAIRHIDPIAEFVLIEDNLDSIEWIVTANGAIDKADIEAAIPVVKKAEADKQNAEAVARAALLERLGITEEEARLLLGGN